MQSAGDLGRAIEEISSASCALDVNLRKELETARKALKAAGSKRCSEILQALEAANRAACTQPMVRKIGRRRTPYRARLGKATAR